MKNWILAIVVMGVTLTHAQERKHEKFTPEQRAQLEVKQLTLKLDLNEKQQKDITKLLTDNKKQNEELRNKVKADKKAGKQITKDERFAMKNQMLDDQIALKKEMKSILNADQYAKWEQMRENGKKEFKQKMKNRRANRQFKHDRK
ncbi:hypothetical protein [Flavobacterium sp. MK4S-17]|uniref:hypothetical protein n=1 Tax=Flavobacterium sp. MK4S-17 TaxID=2543737 RepID=UPI00135B084E|nr:hypothetical protein [Flavobacterium sp. MK4S-17]